MPDVERKCLAAEEVPRRLPGVETAAERLLEVRRERQESVAG